MSDPAERMACPRCPGHALRAAMTREGVEVDICPSCGGVWLDRGELFHFSRRPAVLAAELKAGLQAARVGSLASPKTGQPMLRLGLLGGSLEVDSCPDTQGLWLDRGELDKLLSSTGGDLRFSVAKEQESLPPMASPSERLAAIAAAARPLPNLVLRSTGVLILLYGLLGALLIGCVELGALPAPLALGIGVAVVLLQFLLGPFFMDLSLRWLYHSSWLAPHELPAHLRQFITKVTSERGISFPRVALIHDGAPNAFTYGHHPGNARIVVTRGLFELLDEREVEAVVAHEIGHAVHWDMLVMTMAYLVPLVTYYLFRTVMSVGRSRDSRLEGVRYGVAISAYLVYIASQYIVLWLSRTREYWADRFAGEVTGNPNALASALVKIGYGLAAQQPAAEQAQGEAEGKAKRRAGGKLEAVGALGVFDATAARALVVTSLHGAAQPSLDRERLKNAMRWDLWNPWAKFYELNSTHPLIAKRLDHLGRQAAARGEEPFVVFDQQQPESYWDEFFVDLLVMFLPSLLALITLGAALSLKSQQLLFLTLSSLGVGMLLKTLFSYASGEFPEMSVAALLKQVKVSGVRGVPCTVRGTVIGRGVPGLLWSEDMVMRDESGIIFLDYRQPLRIFEFLFGLLRRHKLDNERIEAQGWYRRAPVPQIELKSFTVQGRRRRCYVYPLKLVFAVLLIALGAVLVLGAR